MVMHLAVAAAGREQLITVRLYLGVAAAMLAAARCRGGMLIIADGRSTTPSIARRTRGVEQARQEVARLVRMKVRVRVRVRMRMRVRASDRG